MFEQAGRRPSAWLLAAFCLCIGVFYLFVYNSGYGSDACEYLMIGRALLRGARISTFVLSKGWATYAGTALALAVIPKMDHTWVAFIVTLLFATVLVATWWVGQRLFNSRVAALAALLVGCCCAFMEMNYLEPEIAIYLSGLAAMYLVNVPGRNPVGRYATAGAALGIGFAFKASVLFYLAGLFGYLSTEQGVAVRDRLLHGVYACAGFLMAVAVPAAYFAATGQFRHHVFWSLIFPLLYYPPSTFYLRKLYTKLLWFFVLLAGSLLLAALRPMRKQVFGDPQTSLTLWMGGLSMISLLKTQSSHYVFPGAAFLSFFMAKTISTWWDRRNDRPLPKWIPASGALLLIASAYLYNPQTFKRLYEKRDYRYEEQIAARLQSLVPADDYALFLQGGKTLYWLADRYPNVPIVDTDVQPIYLLFHQPDMLSKALDDPKLKLVAFNPANPEFDDPRFLASQHHRDLIADFSKRLEQRFTQLPDPEIPFLTLWIRKS